MLNPFLHPMPEQKPRQNHGEVEEYTAQMYGHSLDTASPRPSVGLWVGRLLIRMGHMLTKEDADLQTSREHS